jgi:hypothetical protein
VRRRRGSGEGFVFVGKRLENKTVWQKKARTARFMRKSL